MTPNSSAPVAPDVERLILEQARAFAQELLRVADQAPDGQVLRLAEAFVVAQGREFLRTALATALQAQAPGVEKRGPRPGPVPVASGGTTRAMRPSNV